MPRKPIARKKAAAVKGKKKQVPAYLREIQIKYKKKRVKAGSPLGKKIIGAQQVFELFSDLQNETREKLIAISLDVKLKIICFEVVAIGSLCAVYARPVETLRASIPLNPYGIIIVHHHPSGDVQPSPDDKEFTRKLTCSADDLGLVLHDHVLIGDGEYFGFAEAGLMRSLKRKNAIVD